MATRRPFTPKKSDAPEPPTTAPKLRKPTPFKAADHPHRDFRGEKIVNGVKMRI